MTRLDELKKHLKPGKVYRRSDLTKWSKSVDRHLEQLVNDGTLKKASQGVYSCYKVSAFGKTPPKEEVLVRTFLKDDDFLLTSPNLYNSLGVGTTQLYNKRVVYNHKRHGEFKLGNRVFNFQLKHRFPKTLTEEFLMVDLLNNLDQLAEDKEDLQDKALTKAATMNHRRLRLFVKKYGNARTQKLLGFNILQHG